MSGHDSDLGREGIVLLSLAGVLAVTVVVALVAGGPDWLAVVGVSVSIVWAIALLAMVEWLMGPSEHDDPGA